MTWVSLFCVILGGTLLLAQFGLALMGLGPELDETDALATSEETLVETGGLLQDVEAEGLDTAPAGALPIHTLAAALVFFGLAGLTATALGWTELLAALLATTFGFLAFWTVRHVRGLGRLNDSETRAA